MVLDDFTGRTRVLRISGLVWGHGRVGPLSRQGQRVVFEGVVQDALTAIVFEEKAVTYTGLFYPPPLPMDRLLGTFRIMIMALWTDGNL